MSIERSGYPVWPFLVPRLRAITDSTQMTQIIMIYAYRLLRISGGRVCGIVIASPYKKFKQGGNDGLKIVSVYFVILLIFSGLYKIRHCKERSKAI
jgi:hypothetical protein